MNPDCSMLVGPAGAIAKSGRTIYDLLHDSSEYLLTSSELEAVLRKGLLGLDLNYPLRTRLRVLKSKVCEVLGYPIPASFKKSKPRFPGQDFDTYVQKSNNLQIWNEEILPTRRYVIIRLDEKSTVVGVRVVTGETLAALDTTGIIRNQHATFHECFRRAPGFLFVTQRDDRIQGRGFVGRIEPKEDSDHRTDPECKED
jgi:hypothetical protein